MESKLPFASMASISDDVARLSMSLLAKLAQAFPEYRYVLLALLIIMLAFWLIYWLKR